MNIQAYFQKSFLNIIFTGNAVWLVRVECEGFATVTFDLTNGESMTLFGSGTTLSMSQDQDYKVCLESLENYFTKFDQKLFYSCQLVYLLYFFIFKPQFFNKVVGRGFSKYLIILKYLHKIIDFIFNIILKQQFIKLPIFI